jgi:hypothetical protein
VEGVELSEFHYNLQRQHEEKFVAALLEELSLDNDAIYMYQPDRNFSALDCKLLALLDIEYTNSIGDKRLDVQRKFLDITDRYLDPRFIKRVVQGEIHEQDNLPDAGQQTLMWLHQKLDQDKLVDIMADFWRATGRMMDIGILRDKLATGRNSVGRPRPLNW